MISRLGRSWLIWLVLIAIVFLLFEVITSRPSSNSADQSPTPPTPWHQRFNPATFLPGNFKSPLHPADYLIQPQDDDFCESFYGPTYLQHLADNHIPYCESGSKSDMECFVTHIHDPLCVVRGVAFTANPGEGIKKWGMDCKLRNLTVEIANDKSGKKAQELQKFQNVEDFHEYFYWTGVRMELEQWNVGTGTSAPPSMSTIGKDGKGNGNCDKTNNDGKITLLVKREMNHNVWHKLMELWQAMVTLDALEMTTYHPSSHVPTVGKQPFLTPEARKNIQVVFEDNDVGPVDDLWPLVTGSKPIRQDELEDKCLGTVILPLAGSSSPFWDSHWVNRDCKTRFMLDPFLHRIYRLLGIQERNRLTEAPIVTIVDRRHGTRQIHNLTSHIAHLAQVFPDVTFNAVDFATLSLKEQIVTARNTDVLVGVMGAGLTHILFLPEEAAVAELMTPGTHYAGFRNLSKMRGLGYFTAQGLTEEEWKGNDKQPTGQPQEEHHEWLDEVADHQSSETSAVAAVGAEVPKHKKRHWQNDEYLYFTEEMFTSLVAAAINSQLNRGLRGGDVKPVV